MLFKKSHLNEVLDTTSESMDVFVPAIVDGTSRFALYGEQGEVTEPNFQLQNTKIPPKGLLFPPHRKTLHLGQRSRWHLYRKRPRNTTPLRRLRSSSMRCSRHRANEPSFSIEGLYRRILPGKAKRSNLGRNGMPPHKRCVLLRFDGPESKRRS